MLLQYLTHNTINSFENIYNLNDPEYIREDFKERILLYFKDDIIDWLKQGKAYGEIIVYDEDLINKDFLAGINTIKDTSINDLLYAMQNDFDLFDLCSIEEIFNKIIKDPSLIIISDYEGDFVKITLCKLFIDSKECLVAIVADNIAKYPFDETDIYEYSLMKK
jgi:hypothetical protein